MAIQDFAYVEITRMVHQLQTSDKQTCMVFMHLVLLSFLFIFYTKLFEKKFRGLKVLLSQITARLCNEWHWRSYHLKSSHHCYVITVDAQYNSLNTAITSVPFRRPLYRSMP